MFIAPTALGLLPAGSLGAFAQATQSTPLFEEATPPKPQQAEQRQNKEGISNSAVDNPARPLNQNDATKPSPDASKVEPAPNRSGDHKRSSTESDTIIVTGSNIRGTISPGSDVDVVDRTDIQKSGYATIHQYMQTYVQNFSGGASEDAIGADASGNFTEGAGINLRGLGNSATLVLVNGRRLSISGLDTSFTDVSLVPTSAVNRIEILSDGGSAVYGTDAVAGVVNIILRNDYSGIETQARFGTVTKGSLREYLAGATLGESWSNGSAIITYEYYRRTPLHNSDRRFTSSQDHRSMGGTDRRDIFSNPGNILNPATFEPTYAIPTQQNGLNLTPADLLEGSVNLSSLSSYGEQLGLQNRHSAFAHLEQHLTDTIITFAEGRFARRSFRERGPAEPQFLIVPKTNPFFVDPFGDSDEIYVAYDMTPDMGPSVRHGRVHDYYSTVGASADLSVSTQVRLHASYAQQNSKEKTTNQVDQAALSDALADPNPETAFNPFGHSARNNPLTIEKFRADTINDTGARMYSAGIILDGHLLYLDTGVVKFAIGGDYQRTVFNIHQHGSLRGDDARRDRLTRTVRSAYGEVIFPVLPPTGGDNLAGALDISVAGRLDNYSDVGTTTNPRIGARWNPLESLTVRANFGTSFRAPNMSNLSEARNFASIFTMENPQAPGERMSVIYIAGGNADLDNQTSDNWSIGATWQPSQYPLIRISINYYSIRYENRITPLRDPRWPISRPSEFGHLAMLNPSQSQIAQICGLPYRFLFNRELCSNPAAVGAIVDARYQNFATTRVRGIDLTATAGGRLDDHNDISLDLSAAYVIDHKEALTADTPSEERVDTLGYPVDFRARGSLNWTHKNWLTSSIIGNYTDSYRDEFNAPFLKVRSWTTFDIAISANFGALSSNPALNEFSATLNVVNVFSKDPPFVNGVNYAYDPNNADPIGRFVSLSIVKKW